MVSPLEMANFFLRKKWEEMVFNYVLVFPLVLHFFRQFFYSFFCWIAFKREIPFAINGRADLTEWLIDIKRIHQKLLVINVVSYHTQLPVVQKVFKQVTSLFAYL